MSDSVPRGAGGSLVGYLSLLLAIGSILWMWFSGLAYLDGTPFEELRYVVFTVFVAALLSGLETITAALINRLSQR